jgi:hypothetical protein
MSTLKNRKRLTAVIVVLVVPALVVLGATGITIWYEMFRDVPQPAWITGNLRDNFLYGSIGSEREVGLPYWIFMALPRIFPEYLPGPGGYASLLSWEESMDMPVGFSKKTIGYVRVAGNCALCHAYSRPNGRSGVPTFFPAGHGHTAEVQKLLQFFRRCGQDPRFNADTILAEIDRATKLSFLDRLTYCYIIPRTRELLLHPDSLILDSALWQHSEVPQSDGPSFRQRMQALETVLVGGEKDGLVDYLKTLR